CSSRSNAEACTYSASTRSRSRCRARQSGRRGESPLWSRNDEKLLAEHAPEQGVLKVKRGESGRRGQATPERERQEPGNHVDDVVTGRKEVFLHRHLSQRKKVIGAVEVLARAVLEVRAHDGEDPFGSETLAHALQKSGDVLRLSEVFEQV